MYSTASNICHTKDKIFFSRTSVLHLQYSYASLKDFFFPYRIQLVKMNNNECSLQVQMIIQVSIIPEWNMNQFNPVCIKRLYIFSLFSLGCSTAHLSEIVYFNYQCYQLFSVTTRLYQSHKKNKTQQRLKMCQKNRKFYGEMILQRKVKRRQIK